jgi:large exoprotein involved in heme utilization and adhesion
VISTTTSSSGRAGDLTLEAHTLRIDETKVSTETLGVGRGGDLTLHVQENMTFSGPGVISASALEGTGDGGDVLLTVGRLTVRETGQMSSGTFSEGNAGTLTIRAREDVNLIGIGSVDAPDTLSNQSQGLGDAGTLRIFTDQLNVRNGATISVSGVGEGNPGNLSIEANSILLDRGIIEAQTFSGEQANMSLAVDDYLLLRDRSQIVTEALGTGNGGNINITGPFILAIPDENSDISANAFEGTGVQVSITAQTIVGLVPRSRDDLSERLGISDPFFLDPQRLPSNDITAISQVSPALSGNVVITIPDTDPQRGTIDLPSTPVDATALISQGCRGGRVTTQTDLGEFIVTGRGGLPPNPNGTLDAIDVTTAWVSVWNLSNGSPSNGSLPNQSLEDHRFPPELSGDTNHETRRVYGRRSHDSQGQPVASDMFAPFPTRHSFPIEAQDWMMDEEGNITLFVQETRYYNTQMQQQECSAL